MALSMSSGIEDASQRVGPLPAPPTSLRLDGEPLGLVGTGRVYVCGITPYDVTHLGHAATFVWADLLASAVTATGARPEVCRNVTDVDDVLLDAARRRGSHFDELALVQEAQFEHSMRALRVATPTAQPRARHHVGAVQQLAQVLLDRDAAYERDGTVWFRGGDVPARAGLDRDAAVELARAYGDDPDDPRKDDPLDVAVWRTSEPGVPGWASPWGWGRPGWHAECAAMAVGVLGPSVDVLVGGVDLRFPHHAYQAAMAGAATGVTPFARRVLHVGTVRVAGEKMAKSTGNLVLVDDLLTRTAPEALRLFLLLRDHRTDWDFDPADLAGAAATLDELWAAAARPTAGGHAPGDAVAVVLDGLDVVGAVRLALDAGGEVARRLLAMLRLGPA